MAKKKMASDTKWGPFFDTYEKPDKDGFIWEQEVPSYREVSTPHGVFGIPAGQVLTFEDRTVIEDGQEIVLPVAVFTVATTGKGEEKEPVKAKEPEKTERRVEA